MNAFPQDGSDFEAVEQQIVNHLRAPKVFAIRNLGYGEVTMAVAYPNEAPIAVYKRLPPTKDRRRLERYLQSIELYIAEVERFSVRVAKTDGAIVESAAGRFSLILRQPLINHRALGPAVLKQRRPSKYDEFLNAIFEATHRVVSDEVGLDAQLSNWAWIGGRVVQIDVSTPFLRDTRGRPQLDTGLILLSYPRPLRAPLRRLVLPSVVRRYHDLRACFIDFAANLYRERMEEWIEPAVHCANHFPIKNITLEEVTNYYRNDAKTWEFMYQAKKLQKKIVELLGGSYPFILPPPTDR